MRSPYHIVRNSSYIHLNIPVGTPARTAGVQLVEDHEDLGR